MFKKINLKKAAIVLAVLVVLAGVWYVVRSNQQKNQAAATDFQTVTASRGQLIAMIGATGTVRANQTAQLSWQTSGRVGKVSAAVGERVAAGQSLSELREDSLSQSAIAARSDLTTAQRNLDDLLDSKTSIAQAELALAQAKSALDDAVEDRDRKLYRRASDNTIDELRANYILSQNAVDDAEELFSAFEDRAEDDSARAQALSQLAAARKKRDTSLYNLNYALGLPEPNELAEVEAKLKLAQTKYDDAKRDWERVKDGVDPANIESARARVASAQAVINSTLIEAPFAGTVTMANAQVGDQVNPGTAAFRVDDLSRLLVDVEVSEVDINRVQVGQPATLTFDAVSGREYQGYVSEVASVGTSTSSGVNFIVQIELTDPDDQVHPGMTAAVNVIVNQLDNVLLAPNRAIRLREAERIIYVLRDNQAVAVPVKIGASSDTESEVVSGELAEGDLIILNPPSELNMGPRGAPAPGGGM